MIVEINIGSEYPIERAIAELRAALHEPMPGTLQTAELGGRFARALLSQPGLITSREDAVLTGHALIVATAQLGVLVLGHGVGTVAANVQAYAALYLIDKAYC